MLRAMSREPAQPVIFVLPSFAGGGAERVMLTLANGLLRQGRRTGMILLDAQGPLKDKLDSGMPRFDLERPRLREALLYLLKTLRGLGAAEIVSSFGYVNLALALIKPALPRGTRLYFREANMPSALRRLGAKGIAVRWAYRLLYPRAERILVTSQAMRDEFVRDLGLPPEKLHLLPNPVDEGALRGFAPKRSPGAGLRFVAAGRLTRQKGFDRLLPLVASLPMDAELLIFGDGEERANLEAQAQQLGLGSRLRLMGWQKDAPAWIGGADALLLPSRWEGLPNVALEALALGTPVIATPESGGIAEIAQAAAPAAITLAGLPEEFARAMAALQPAGALDQLRPSLLPETYRARGVIAALDALTSRPA